MLSSIYAEFFKKILWVHTGTPEARTILHRAQKRCVSIKNQIELLKSRWPDEEIDEYEEEAPIFLFSAGWRSGSTLLQRLLVSTGEIFVWGEPYNSACIIESLARPILIFDENRPTFHEIWSNDCEVKELSQKWIANLSPPPVLLKQAMRKYFHNLFFESVGQENIKTWGIKDVRVSADYCYFLKWLWPKAKFILLYRNPYDSYISYRRYRRWFLSIPDKPVFTPYRFGKVWLHLTDSFLKHFKDLNALLIRYEDLKSEKRNAIFKELESHIDTKLDISVLDNKIGSSWPTNLKKMKSDHLLVKYELLWLRLSVKSLASRLDYNGPSSI